MIYFNLGYIKPYNKMGKEAALPLSFSAQYVLHLIRGHISTPLLPFLESFQQMWWEQNFSSHLSTRRDTSAHPLRIACHKTLMDHDGGKGQRPQLQPIRVSEDVYIWKLTKSKHCSTTIFLIFHAMAKQKGKGTPDIVE